MFKVTEWTGGEETIVTVACPKSAWLKVVNAAQERDDLRRQVEELTDDLNERKLLRMSLDTQRGHTQRLADQLAAREAELAARDARIAVLTKALEFYAHSGTYEAIEIRNGNGGYGDPPITFDEGERARKAISGKESK